jgi:hypothetical protein
MADLLMKMPIPYEPKRKNRFIMSFNDLGINEWFVESTSRPSLTIGSTPIDFLNTKTYVAGKYEWGEISVTFRDPIGPSASQALMEWVRLHAESVTGRMGYAAGYKRDIFLSLLDPTGVVIEKWVLKNTFLTKVDFQGLSYSEDGLVTIQASLRPDYCVLLY